MKFTLLIIILLAAIPCGSQTFYFYYETDEEINFQVIREPIEPLKFSEKIDSLCEVYHCTGFDIHCMWVNQSFLLNTNGGYSDCSIIEIKIKKGSEKGQYFSSQAFQLGMYIPEYERPPKRQKTPEKLPLLDVKL